MKMGDFSNGDTYLGYMSPFVPHLQSGARIRSEPARRTERNGLARGTFHVRGWPRLC